jgi:uncharacterized membrane protein YphA (DoxX/SURF4 family)
MESGGALAATIGTAFLALVFLRAILHKLGGYAEYVGIVRDYRMLPEPLARVVAPAALALECLAVAGLVLPQTRVPAAILAAALLVGYAAAMAWNLARGRTTIDCGCGGGGHGISPLHVLRNGLLAVFAVPVIAYPSAVLAGSGPFIAAAGCALVLWMTFLTFDQLLSNHTHANATGYVKL